MKGKRARSDHAAQTRGTKLTRRRLLATSASIAAGGLLGAGLFKWPLPSNPAALAAAPAAPKGPITLKFWYIAQGPAFEPVLKAVVKHFEETHPSIKVEVDVQPTVEMRNKVRPVFTTGGPGPDVLYEGAVQTLTYATMPFGFIDIGDRVKASGVKERSPKAAWAPLESGGKTYGVPLNAFPFFMGYNKDLYTAAGLRAIPQDWEEQLQFMKKIWSAQRDTWGFVTFTNRFVSWLFETLMYDSGIGYFQGSENWDRFDVTRPVTFNSSQGVRILEYIRDLAETAPGGLRGNFGVDSARAIVMFARGNLGHYHGHSIHFSQITLNNPNMVGGRNFDVYAFPKGSRRRGAQFSTSVMGITKGSKDPDAAWDLVGFITDRWEGLLAASIGTVPVRYDVRLPSDAPMWLIDAGRKALAGDSFSSAWFPQLDLVRDALAKEVEAFFLGQKNAKQALDSAAEEFTKQLRR